MRASGDRSSGRMNTLGGVAVLLSSLLCAAPSSGSVAGAAGAAGAERVLGMFCNFVVMFRRCPSKEGCKE